MCEELQYRIRQLEAENARITGQCNYLREESDVLRMKQKHMVPRTRLDAMAHENTILSVRIAKTEGRLAILAGRGIDVELELNEYRTDEERRYVALEKRNDKTEKENTDLREEVTRLRAELYTAQNEYGAGQYKIGTLRQYIIDLELENERLREYNSRIGEEVGVWREIAHLEGLDRQ